MREKANLLARKIFATIIALTMSIPPQAMANGTGPVIYDASSSVMGIAQEDKAEIKVHDENSSQITKELKDYILDIDAQLDSSLTELIYTIKARRKEKIEDDSTANLSFNLTGLENSNITDLRLVDASTDVEVIENQGKEDKIKNLAIKAKPADEIIFTIKAAISKAKDARIYDLKLALSKDNENFDTFSYKLKSEEKTTIENGQDIQVMTLVQDLETKPNPAGTYKEEGILGGIFTAKDTITWTDYVLNEEENKEFVYDFNLDSNQETENAKIALDYYEATERGFEIKKEFSQAIDFAKKISFEIPQNFIAKITLTTQVDKKNTAIKDYSLNNKKTKNPMYIEESEEKSSDDDEEGAKVESEESKEVSQNNSQQEHAEENQEAKGTEDDIKIEDANSKDKEEEKSTQEDLKDSTIVVKDSSGKEIPLEVKENPAEEEEDKTNQISALILNKDSLLSQLREENTLTTEKENAIKNLAENLDSYNDEKITDQELKDFTKAQAENLGIEKTDLRFFIESILSGLNKQTNKAANLNIDEIIDYAYPENVEPKDGDEDKNQENPKEKTQEENITEEKTENPEKENLPEEKTENSQIEEKDPGKTFDEDLAKLKEEAKNEENQPGLLEGLKSLVGLTDLAKADKELKAALADEKNGIVEIQNLLDSFGEKYKLSRTDQAKLMEDNGPAIKKLIEKDADKNFRPQMLVAAMDSHWVPSPDTKLQDGKTYVFRVKGTEHVLVHHKDDVDDKNLTRASVTVIPGENSPNDDILTNVPLSAPWTVNYKVQDKGPGFIFYNGHNGDHYIQGDTWLPKEKDAAVNAYTPSDGRIQNVDKEEYLCWQADENQYYLRKDEDDYSARLEKFDLYELGSSLDRYEITITNTPGEPQPETSTSLIVKKEWSDSDAHDSVVVRLMRTGSGGMEESTGRTITLSADNNWEGVFDNLEIPEDGQKFAYFVKEESVPGYTTSYSEVENVAGSYWVPSSSNALVEGKNYVFLVRGTNYVLDHTRGETMKRGTATIGLDGSLMDVPSTAVWTAGSNTILYHTLGSTIYYMAEDKMTPKISEATGKIYTEKGYLGDKTKGGEYHYWSLGDNKYGIDENKDDSISEIFGLYEMGGETSAYQVVITNEKDTPTSTTDLSVKKEWGDPEKDHAPVMITLMRIDPDGNTRSTGRTLTLSDDNNWEGVFDNLSIPAEGEKFPYFVEEEEIADYITSYGDIEIVSGTSWEKKSFGTELVEGNDYVFVVKDKPFVLNHTSGEALRRGDVTVGSDGSLMDVPSTAIWTAGKNSKGHIILYHTLGGKTYYMAEDKMTSKMSEATGKTYTSKGYLGDRTKGGEYLYWDKSLYGIDEDKDDSVSEIFNLYTMTSSSDSYKTVIKNIPVDPEPEEKSKIHKTIDYLGDGDINPHTALTGKDFYRLYLDIFGSIQPVLISDELSAYVAYHRDQSDLKVIRTDKNGTITTIWENGVPTASNVDAYGIPIVQQVLYEPSNAQYSTGKVTVMFNSECQLDDENSFSLSFNVKITDYAKEQAVEKGYNAVGDADTDYGNNQTSSEMPGFRSNNSAYTTYISQDMGYRIEYLHPVIQTGGAKLQINKVDGSGKPLAGAEFKLSLESDPNTFFEAVSTTEGKVSFSKIPFGTYILEETKVPEGYVKTSDTWRVVVSETGVSYYKKVETTTTTPTTPQEIPELTITNYKKPSIEFFKTTEKGTPLAGAKFQLYKKTGAEGTATRMPVGGEVTVGEDGRIYFENLDVGNYELVETQAPVGYKKLEDPAVTFEVTDKGEVTNIYGKELDTSTGKNNIWNWRLPEMEVELKKLDGHLEAILEGNVEFKLTKAPDNKTGGEVPKFLQTLSFADLNALQADRKTLKFNIPLEMDGEYILEETKAPDGYMRSFDKYHIMISQADRTIKLVKITTNVLGVLKDYKYKDSSGKEVSVKLTENPITLYSEKDKEQGVKNDTLSLDLGIINQKAVYPSTGGIGSLIFAIVGAGLMTAAYIEYKRKKVIE